MQILALVPPGTNARSIFLDLIRGARQAGHDIFQEELAHFLVQQQQFAQAGASAQASMRESQMLFASYIEHAARSLGCQAIMSLWLEPLLAIPQVNLDGKLMSYFESVGIPMIHYWLDAPFWAYEGRLAGQLNRARFTSPMHIHIVNNAGTAEEMRQVLNFQTVIDQPYGVDTTTFRPWPEIAQEFELAINAGPGDPAPSPLMLQELKRDEPDVPAIRADQRSRIRVHLIQRLQKASPATAVGLIEHVADRWLDEQFKDPDRPMLEKFEAALKGAVGSEQLRETLLQTAESARHWTDVTAMIRAMDSWQRAFISAYLAARFRTILVGSGAEAWKKAGWPFECPATGPVAYHELAVCYSRAAVGLNVMRYQDDIGMNLKGLEIAASGAVALQRWRSGVEGQTVDGESGLTFASPTDAAEKLRGVLGDEFGRVSMVEAGLTKTRSENSWTAQAAQLFEKLQQVKVLRARL